MNIFKVTQSSNTHPNSIKFFICYALKEEDVFNINPCETDRDQWVENKKAISIEYIGSKTNAPRNHIVCRSRS